MKELGFTQTKGSAPLMTEFINTASAYAAERGLRAAPTRAGALDMEEAPNWLADTVVHAEANSDSALAVLLIAAHRRFQESDE